MTMKFDIIFYQDEDGVFIAECPSIPGCVSQGKTAEEAEENIQDAIRECLIVRSEKGMPLTVKTKQVEVTI
jgi:predicted RNase H-like HicB family nuclease